MFLLNFFLSGNTCQNNPVSLALETFPRRYLAVIPGLCSAIHLLMSSTLVASLSPHATCLPYNVVTHPETVQPSGDCGGVQNTEDACEVTGLPHKCPETTCRWTFPHHHTLLALHIRKRNGPSPSFFSLGITFVLQQCA